MTLQLEILVFLFTNYLEVKFEIRSKYTLGLVATDLTMWESKRTPPASNGEDLQD